MNLLEVGKIVRAHGIKGAVKVISYVDEDFSSFKHIYLTNKKLEGKIISVKSLNSDAYSVTIDIIKDVETAETYKNQSVYIDRDEYGLFKDKVYFSDLIGKSIIDENGQIIGELIDYDDFGASIILTIKCGAISYSIPYINDIIKYNKNKQEFEIDKQRFEDLRVWE